METAQAEVKAEKEVPLFEVVQAPGFATGLQLHPPGAQIPWEVPDGWNEKKWGRHFASYGPSLTFKALNPSAEKLMEQHKAMVAEKNKPRPTDSDKQIAAMKEMQLETMKMMLEAQAEQRRTNERLAEALEQLTKKK